MRERERLTERKRGFEKIEKGGCCVVAESKRVVGTMQLADREVACGFILPRGVYPYVKNVTSCDLHVSSISPSNISKAIKVKTILHYFKRKM